MGEKIPDTIDEVNLSSYGVEIYEGIDESNQVSCSKTKILSEVI